MKTPAERGPFATWVVETRNALDLTAEWIASQTGYDDATIRKLEGGAVTRPQRRKVTELLQRVAAEKGMRIPPPPGEAQPADDQATLMAVLSEIRDELRLSRLVSERSAVVMAELLGTLAKGRLLPEGTPDASDARVESGIR